MAGVEGRVGSIEDGKDADLVLWNGQPFEATSRVVGVLIDGRLILDPRSQN
jgi:imidazolonepropionase-like amidohydrolase